jgi:hypothetical protein
VAFFRQGPWDTELSQTKPIPATRHRAHPEVADWYSAPPPSTVARERLLAMIREDQGPEADVATVLVDVADQLRAVAARMNTNAAGA